MTHEVSPCRPSSLIALHVEQSHRSSESHLIDEILKAEGVSGIECILPGSQIAMSSILRKASLLRKKSSDSIPSSKSLSVRGEKPPQTKAVTNVAKAESDGENGGVKRKVSLGYVTIYMVRSNGIDGNLANGSPRFSHPHPSPPMLPKKISITLPLRQLLISMSLPPHLPAHPHHIQIAFQRQLADHIPVWAARVPRHMRMAYQMEGKTLRYPEQPRQSLPPCLRLYLVPRNNQCLRQDLLCHRRGSLASPDRLVCILSGKRRIKRKARRMKGRS